MAIHVNRRAHVRQAVELPVRVVAVDTCWGVALAVELDTPLGECAEATIGWLSPADADL